MKKSATFYVDKDLKRRFKVKCAERDKQMNHIVEALMRLFNEVGDKYDVNEALFAEFMRRYCEEIK